MVRYGLNASSLGKNGIDAFLRTDLSCPNVSTTPITAMGCRQCLPLSVVQLKGKHCQKPHCRNGVVGTFGLSHLYILVVGMLKWHYWVLEENEIFVHIKCIGQGLKDPKSLISISC